MVRSSGHARVQKRKDAEKWRHLNVEACGGESAEAHRRECIYLRKCQCTEGQSCESVEELMYENFWGEVVKSCRCVFAEKRERRGVDERQHRSAIT